MNEFTPAHSEFRAFRDGYAVAVWTDGREVLIRARPQQGEVPERTPALPSSARIVVWEPRRGMLRDRLRRPSLWARFVAWLRHTRVPTADEQVELLADELVTAIEHAVPSDAPWAETQRGDRPATAPPRVIMTMEEPRRSFVSRIVRLGVVAALAVILSLAAAFALWRTASGDGNAGEAVVLAQSRPSVERGSSQSVGQDAVALTTPTPTAEAGVETSVAVKTSAEATAEGDAQIAGFEHVVESGDTLAAIARTFGVSVSDLRSANALVEGDPIYPGQVLRIP